MQASVHQKLSDRNGIAVGRIAVPALCVFQTFEFDDHYLAYRRCALLGVGPDCTFVDINNFLGLFDLAKAVAFAQWIGPTGLGHAGRGAGQGDRRSSRGLSTSPHGRVRRTHSG